MFLKMSQIEQIKKAIDNHHLPCRYFITLSWSGAELERMRQDICSRHQNKTAFEVDDLLLDWTINQGRRYFVNLSRTSQGKLEGGGKPHLETYWGVGGHWEHFHLHALVLSDKRIWKGKALKLWKHGKETDFQVYDPDYQGGHLTESCVHYIFSKHLAIKNEKGHFHPSFRSCRKGTCETCKRIKSNALRLKMDLDLINLDGSVSSDSCGTKWSASHLAACPVEAHFDLKQPGKS